MLLALLERVEIEVQLVLSESFAAIMQPSH